MRKYVDTSGGLSIEKKDNTVQAGNTKSILKTNIDAQKLIDTMQSYQLPTLSKTPTEKGGNDCEICGNHIDYDNRYICFECWKKYSNDFFDGIKQNLKGVEIKII